MWISAIQNTTIRYDLIVLDHSVNDHQDFFSSKGFDTERVNQTHVQNKLCIHMYANHPLRVWKNLLRERVLPC